jgi:hypothetical protein
LESKFGGAPMLKKKAVTLAKFRNNRGNFLQGLRQNGSYRRPLAEGPEMQMRRRQGPGADAKSED